MPPSTDDPRKGGRGTPPKVKALPPKPAPAKARPLPLHKRDPRRKGG